MFITPFFKFLNLLSFKKDTSNEPLLSQEAVKKLFLNMTKQQNPMVYFPHDQRLVQSIKNSVKEGNINNITRTKCYISFFKRNPEIHWSFLAHMVSRNAGYHMTDLKSDFLSEVLQDVERLSFYSFLELCNAEIFRDAYPQLLLYEHWKRTGTSQLHLLRKFNVSRFMVSIWQEFMTQKNTKVLTIGLIMNEQHMIQNRIINDFWRKFRFEKWLFLLQDRLEVGSVLFPYGKGQPFALAGLPISHFEQVEKRIDIGKRLYSILFHKGIFPTTFTYAISYPHTASRSDYWPFVYSKNKKENYLFSPELKNAWPNKILSTGKTSDWIYQKSLKDMSPLLTNSLPGNFHMTTRWKILTTLLLNVKKK
ncbi:DUF2515 family protein [Rossellomorea aquimaris]|uniref:DUF2515 family protein n=1 Tax=Rossellomorea aquimaris TaxID=189382 RepID=UPI0007D0AFCF|nr:DUF2515 family protein [Rossellomorea aquimaris]